MKIWFRVLHLLNFKKSAMIGWREDGTDLMENVKVTSLKLRALGAEITSESEYADFTVIDGNNLAVIMKNGASIPLTQDTVGYRAEKWINLDQADYLLLGDGTRLPVPHM